MRRGVASLVVYLAVAACNSRPNGTMTAPNSSPTSSSAPSTAGGGLPAIADAGDHVTAEAVVWSGQLAIVVGSAGHVDDAPPGSDPIRVDGARYHAWLRAIDARGAASWSRRIDDAR